MNADAADTPETPEDAPLSEEASGPKNNVSVEDAGVLKKKVSIEVPRERIDAKFDEMFGELSQSAQVPGFRVGHAPRRLIEKRFGREVGQDVRNALLGEALGESLEDLDLKTVGEPDIDVDAVELPDSGPMRFSFEVEVAPEFELPELEKIPVKRPKLEITDERIDEYLEQFRQSRASFEVTEEPAEDASLLTTDTTVVVEGVEPVEKPGLPLRVAAGQVEGIPLVDLADTLRGKAPGDAAELTVTVPESHPNEEWRGKEAKISITVKEVRRRVLPELDDEFASQLGFDSVQDMRDMVRGQLQARIAQEVVEAEHEHIRQYLLENTEMDLPEGVTARHAQRLLQRQYVNLLMRGTPREQLDSRMAELQAEADQQARRDLKLQFILGRIIDERDIEVDESEINARIAAMAAQYNRRPERMRSELEQDGSLSALQSEIAERKALDALLETAEIEDVEPGEETDEGEAESSES
jgi:trigger factor